MRTSWDFADSRSRSRWVTIWVNIRVVGTTPEFFDETAARPHVGRPVLVSRRSRVSNRYSERARLLRGGARSFASRGTMNLSVGDQFSIRRTVTPKAKATGQGFTVVGILANPPRLRMIERHSSTSRGFTFRRTTPSRFSGDETIRSLRPRAPDDRRRPSVPLTIPEREVTAILVRNGKLNVRAGNAEPNQRKHAGPGGGTRSVQIAKLMNAIIGPMSGRPPGDYPNHLRRRGGRRVGRDLQLDERSTARHCGDAGTWVLDARR